MEEAPKYPKLFQTEQKQGDFLLQTSNPGHVIIPGLSLIRDFVSSSEQAKILSFVDEEKDRWVKDAFRKHRHQIYSNCTLDDAAYNNRAEFDENWGWLISKINKVSNSDSAETDKIINNIRVEELSGTYPSGPNVLDDMPPSCNVVYELHLIESVLVSYRLPVERRNDCWDLKAATKVLVPRRGLVVKTGECLSDWRTNVSTANKNDLIWGLPDGDVIDLRRETKFRLVKIKFCHVDREGGKSLKAATRTPSGASSKDELLNADQLGGKLLDRLTIIVTTSPIKSNPSTELLESTFDTFKLAGDEFAYHCKKIIVCDGFRRKNDKVTQKHANPKQAMRNGIVDSDQADNYIDFKRALRDLIAAENDREQKSVFHNTEVIELDERHGYGFALKRALQIVSTPYVCVIQHDRTFMRQTPIKEVVNSMVLNPGRVKYVGISMRSNLMYGDIFLSKYGKAALGELEEMSLYLPSLVLSNETYGDGGSSAASATGRSERIKKNIIALKKTYFGSYQGRKRAQEVGPGKVQLSLTPTLFWYDNTHVCDTAHYRDFVFDPRLKMVARGGFVEDKLSPNILKAVERRGLTMGHSRYGCYLLDDHSGVYFTGHLDGGNFLTNAEKDALVSSKRIPKKS